jgi:hypothetical protein
MGWAKHQDVDKTVTTSGRYYPYKGLLLCQTCKFNVTAYTKPKKLATGAITEYVFYTCTKKNRQVICKEPQLASLLLEQEIKRRMTEFEISSADGEVCKGWVQGLYDDHIAQKNQYQPVWL